MSEFTVHLVHFAAVALAGGVALAMTITADQTARALRKGGAA